MHRILSCVAALCASRADAVRAIEVPEVAVCISGAVRSFATVPVLRGLKRLVLQNPTYSAAAFAATVQTCKAWHTVLDGNEGLWRVRLANWNLP